MVPHRPENYERITGRYREIMELVRQSTLQFENPDNVYGYGTPDFWRAYMVGLSQ